LTKQCVIIKINLCVQTHYYKEKIDHFISFHWRTDIREKRKRFSFLSNTFTSVKKEI
jgi:hypothetical protein